MNLLRLVFEVIEEDVESVRVLTVVGDDGHGAVDDLGSVTLGINAAEAAHLAKLLARHTAEERRLVLNADGLDELDVLRLVAVISKAAHAGSALVERLAALVEATAEAVVDQGLLEDFAQGGVDVHGFLSSDLLDDSWCFSLLSHCFSYGVLGLNVYISNINDRRKALEPYKEKLQASYVVLFRFMNGLSKEQQL